MLASVTTEILPWLSKNPFAINAILILAFLVVLAVVFALIVATINGQSISFWPPNIGARVGRVEADVSKVKDETHQKMNDGNQSEKPKIVDPKTEEPSEKSIKNQPMAWGMVGVILVSFVIIFIGFAFYILKYNPFSLTALNQPANRLITYHDFEGTDDGWSEYRIQELDLQENVKRKFPEDSIFPGTINHEISSDYALTGEHSLKVTTSVTAPGTFKSFVLRKGGFIAGGMTVYAFAPELPNVNIAYIQLCIASHGWPCSEGTKLVAGEWTPVTIDLEQMGSNGIVLSKQRLTEVAVQWRFEAIKETTFSIYFDSGQIFHSGR